MIITTIMLFKVFLILRTTSQTCLDLFGERVNTQCLQLNNNNSRKHTVVVVKLINL